METTQSYTHQICPVIFDFGTSHKDFVIHFYQSNVKINIKIKMKQQQSLFVQTCILMATEISWQIWFVAHHLKTIAHHNKTVVRTLALTIAICFAAVLTLIVYLHCTHIACVSTQHTFTVVSDISDEWASWQIRFLPVTQLSIVILSKMKMIQASVSISDRDNWRHFIWPLRKQVKKKELCSSCQNVYEIAEALMIFIRLAVILCLSKS